MLLSVLLVYLGKVAIAGDVSLDGHVSIVIVLFTVITIYAFFIRSYTHGDGRTTSFRGCRTAVSNGRVTNVAGGVSSLA